MRLLYLTQRLPFAPNRGDRLRAYYMLRHLARHHDVHLVSLAHDEEEASHAADLNGLAASVTIGRPRALHRLANAAGALAARKTLTHALLDAPGLTASLERLVARHRPQLVIGYCSGMARFALEPPLQRRPLVVDMVDVDSEKWSALGRTARAPMRWIYRREAVLLRRFERRALAQAAATLVVNEREAALLRDVGAGRIDVVPNGIELDGLQPAGPPPTAPRVVFCGVMNYAPNEAAALWLGRTIWPLVRRERPDAALTLVGAHPTRRLHQLAESDPTIDVTGSVDDVRPFLWRSAVSVAPLLVARGIQNKVLEATAAGLPSVVTRAVYDGLPIEVTAACARAEDAPAFSRAILRLLSLGADERRAIAGRAALDRLAWSHTLAPLEPILDWSVRARPS